MRGGRARRRPEVARAFGGTGAEIKLDNPQDKLKLWSPDDPFLYDLSVRLKQGDEVVDEVGSYFGMRKIELAKDAQGFDADALNGEFVFQIGPLDQGFWPDGLYTAPTDEALRYDIEVTKQLGFNMARKHVKVEPERWYYWCDKLGLLVWQDMPSGNNNDARVDGSSSRPNCRRMVEGLRNHPSIIMWVVFNEGWGQHDTERYVDQVQQAGSDAAGQQRQRLDRQAGGRRDRHPQLSRPGRARAEPNRAGVLGEFGGLGLGSTATPGPTRPGAIAARPARTS